MADILEVDQRFLPIGSTPLHLAANNNDTKTLTQLFHSFSDASSMIDRLDGHGRTPLVVALQNGRTEAAIALINFGASLKTLYQSNQTILDVLATEPFRPIVRGLLQLDTPVALSVDHVSPLVHELAYDDGENAESTVILDDLLSKFTGVDAKDHLGYTALHYASVRGNLNLVLLLMRFSADPCIPNTSGSTALHLASGKGHLKVVKALVTNVPELRSVLNAQDNLGRTPLHLALYNRRFTVIRYFVEEFKPDLDLSVRDNQGHSLPTLLYTVRFSPGIRLEETVALPCLSPEEATWMLHDSVAQECIEGVVSALSYGAIINSFDLMQQTPFLLASKLGNLEICKALVENGGNPNAHDAAMKTPMHYVCELGHVQVMEYILTLPDINLQLFYSTYDHPLTVEQLNTLVLYFQENPGAQRPSCWIDWLTLAASNPAVSPQAFNSLVDEICPSDWLQHLLTAQFPEKDEKTLKIERDADVSLYPLLSALVEIEKDKAPPSLPHAWRPRQRSMIKKVMKECKPFISQKEPSAFVFKTFKQAKGKRPPFRKRFSGPRCTLESLRNNKYRALLYCTVVYQNISVFEYLLRRCLEQVPDCTKILFVGTSAENVDVEEFLKAIAKQFPSLEASFDSLQVTEYLKKIFHEKLTTTEASMPRDILIYLLSNCTRYKSGRAGLKPDLLKSYLWQTMCEWYFNSIGKTGHVTFDSDEDKQQLASFLLDNCSCVDFQPLGADSAHSLDGLDPLFLFTAVECNCMWGVQLLLKHGASPAAHACGRFAITVAVKRCHVPMVDTLLESGSHDFLNHPHINKLLPVLCESLPVFASHNEPKTIQKILESFNLKGSDSLWCSSRGPRLLYLLLMSGSEESVELGKSLTDSAASYLCQSLLYSKEHGSIDDLVRDLLGCLSVTPRTHKEFLKCFLHLLTVCKVHNTHHLTFHYLCGNGLLDVASFFLDHLSSVNINDLLNLADCSNKSPLYYAACSGNLNIIQLVYSSAARVTAELCLLPGTFDDDPPLKGYLASLAHSQLLFNDYRTSSENTRHPSSRSDSKLNLKTLLKSLLPSRDIYSAFTTHSPETQLAIVEMLLPEPEQLKQFLQTHGLCLVRLIASSLESKATEKVLAAILPLLDSVDVFNPHSGNQEFSDFVETMTYALPFTVRVSAQAISLFDSLLVKVLRMCSITGRKCSYIFEIYTRRGFWELCHEYVMKSNLWVESCHGHDTLTNMLVLAAKHGKCDILRSTYCNSPLASEDWVRNLMDNLFTVAAKNNQVDVVHFLLLQDGLSLSAALTSGVKFGNKETLVMVLYRVRNTQPDLLGGNLLVLLQTATRYNRLEKILGTLVPLIMSSNALTSNATGKQFLLSCTILMESTKRGNSKLAMLSLYFMPKELLKGLSEDDCFHPVVYYCCYWGLVDVLRRLPITKAHLLRREPQGTCNPWECAMFQGHLGKISYLPDIPSLKEANEEYLRVRFPFEMVGNSFYDFLILGCFQSLVSGPSSTQETKECRNNTHAFLRTNTLVAVGVFNAFVGVGLSECVRGYLRHLGRYAGPYIYLLTEELTLLNELMITCKSARKETTEVLEMILDALKEAKLIKKYLVSFGNALLNCVIEGGNAKMLVALVSCGTVEEFFPKGGPTDVIASALSKAHPDDDRKKILTKVFKSAVRTRKPKVVEVLLNFLKDDCRDEGVAFESILEHVYALGATDILRHTSLLEVASRTSQSTSPSWVSEARNARGWFNSMMCSNALAHDRKESGTVINNFMLNLREVSFPKLLSMAVKYRQYNIVKFLLLASGHLLLSSESVDPCVLFDPVVQQLISDSSLGVVPLNSTLSRCENPQEILFKLNRMSHTGKEIVAFVKFPGLYSQDTILNTFTSACSLGKLEVVRELVSRRVCTGPVQSTLDKDAVESGMAIAVATGNYDIAAYLHFECGVLFKSHHLPVSENLSELTHLIFTCTDYSVLVETFFNSLTESDKHFPVTAAWLAHNWTELEKQFLVKQVKAKNFSPSNPWSVNLTTQDGVTRRITLSIDWDSFSECLLHTPVCLTQSKKRQLTPFLLEATVFSPAVLGRLIGFPGSDKRFNQLSFAADLDQTRILMLTCTLSPSPPSFSRYDEQGVYELTLSYFSKVCSFQFPEDNSPDLSTEMVPDLSVEMVPSLIDDSGVKSLFESSEAGRGFAKQLETLACDFEPQIKKVLWKDTKVSVLFDTDLLDVQDNTSFSYIHAEATHALNDCIDAVKLVKTPAVLYSDIFSKSSHLPKIRSISGKSPLVKELEVRLTPPGDFCGPALVTRMGEIITIEIVISPQEDVSNDSLEQAAVCESGIETNDRSLYETLLEELTLCFLEAETETTKAKLEETITEKIVPNLRHSLKTGPLDSDFVSLGFQDSAGNLLRMSDLNQDHFANLKSLFKVANFIALFAKLLQVFSYKPRALKNMFQCGLKVVLSESEGTGFSDRGGHSLITLSATDFLVKTQKDSMFSIFNLVIDAVSKTGRRKLSIEKFAPGIPAPFGCYVDYRRSPGYLFPVKNTTGSIVVQLVNYSQEFLSAPPSTECELSVRIKTPSSKVIYASSSTEPHPHTASKHLMVNTAPDGVFVIEWTPLESGFYHILVLLNKVPIHGSPLKAFSSDGGEKGSRQSIAGKHFVFISAHSGGRHMCRGNHTHLPVVLSKRQRIKPLCIRALQPLLEAENENTKDVMSHDPYGSTTIMSHDPYGNTSVVSHDPYGNTSVVSHNPYDIHVDAADPTHSQGEPSLSLPMEDKDPPTHHISMCSENGGPSKWFSMSAGNVSIYISPDSNPKAKQNKSKRLRDYMYFTVSCLPLSNGLSRVTIECTKAGTFRVFVGCSTCQSVMDTYWFDHFGKDPARCFTSPGPFSVRTSSIKFVSKSKAHPKDRAHTLTAGSQLKLVFKAVDSYGNPHTSGGAVQSVVISNADKYEYQQGISHEEIQQVIARRAKDVVCQISDEGNGTYTITGMVYTSGYHVVSITAPFSQVVGTVKVVCGTPFGPNCRLLGSNVYQTPNSQKYSCSVALYDQFMNECKAPVWYKKASGYVGENRLYPSPSVPSFPTRMSTYLDNNIAMLVFTPRTHGNFQLKVTVSGQPVPPTPLPFTVIKIDENFKTRFRKLKGFVGGRFGSTSTPTFTIDRSDILESALRVFTLHPEYFQQHLKVRFGEEIGVDAGGLSKEFFHLLSLKLVDPHYALFQSINGLYKPSHSSSIHDSHLLYFEFFGKILARAIADGHQVPVRFTPSVYKYLLGQKCTLDDLKMEEPTLHTSLLAIMNSGTEEDLQEIAINFTALRSHFGSVLTVELEEGGEEKMVTMGNREEFVQKLYQWHLIECISQQLSSMKKGLNSLLPQSQLSDFSSYELEVILCGQLAVDVNFIRDKTSYIGYTAQSIMVKWLWEVLQSMSQEERCKFLLFSTGCACLPSADLGQWSFRVQRGAFNPSLLPIAATCFNSITLPEYKSKEILREKLMVAISYGQQAFLRY